MKNYLAIFMGSALAVAAFASCSKLNENPVFDANESYAAFDTENYAVPERADLTKTTDDTLVIPVSIASYQPVKTNVAYKIIDNKADTTYSATEGVDFVDLNADKVIIFDGKARTMYINIVIKEHRGVFTGDLTFAVQIVSASGLKLSAENTAYVTITDNDHPLAEMLGKYTVTSKAYDGSDKPAYTMTLSKDPSDVTVVWIDFITQGCAAYSSWGDWSYVGTVSGDAGNRVITIARGQKTVSAWYASLTDLFELYTYTEVSGGYIMGMSNTGSFEMTQKAGASTVTFTTDANIWLKTVESGKLYTNFVAATPVWTKQ